MEPSSISMNPHRPKSLRPLSKDLPYVTHNETRGDHLLKLKTVQSLRHDTLAITHSLHGWLHQVQEAHRCLKPHIKCFGLLWPLCSESNRRAVCWAEASTNQGTPAFDLCAQDSVEADIASPCRQNILNTLNLIPELSVIPLPPISSPIPLLRLPLSGFGTLL